MKQDLILIQNTFLCYVLKYISIRLVVHIVLYQFHLLYLFLEI